MKVKDIHKMLEKTSPEVRAKVIHQLAADQVMLKLHNKKYQKENQKEDMDQAQAKQEPVDQKHQKRVLSDKEKLVRRAFRGFENNKETDEMLADFLAD